MLEKTLLRIAKILDENKIPYMLIGGYAMALHGVPRMTQDVDISLGIDIDQIDTILSATRSEYVTIVENPVEFARNTNVLLLQDRETGVRVDMIFTFIDFERDAIARSDKFEILGKFVSFVSLNDLIVYKMLAGRERDKEDVRTILATQASKLDIRWISDTIEGLSSLIQNDAYAQWRAI